MRPTLSKDIQIGFFKDYYWLKSELQVYCKENGISTSGSKTELITRIEAFLLTGEINNAKVVSKTGTPTLPLSLEFVITEQHRCSQDVRAFFKSAIGPQFHFSTYIQNFFKENIGKTYRDVVEAWNQEASRKKNPSYKTKIPPQFEYNQFTRDFFADSANKGKSLKEAIAAWNAIKKHPRSKKFTSYE